MEGTGFTLYIVIIFGLICVIGYCVGSALMNLEAPKPAVMVENPKPRVKGWQEQMMDRVFDHCKVGKYEMTSDTSMQVSTPNNPTLGDLRIYKCEMQIGLDKLEHEMRNVQYDIPEAYGSPMHDDWFNSTKWSDEVNHRTRICQEYIRQIKPILYKIDAMIGIKMDEERRESVQPKQNDNQLALDF